MVKKIVKLESIWERVKRIVSVPIKVKSHRLSPQLIFLLNITRTTQNILFMLGMYHLMVCCDNQLALTVHARDVKDEMSNKRKDLYCDYISLRLFQRPPN